MSTAVPAAATRRGALRSAEKAGLVAVMVLMALGALLVTALAVVSIVLGANGTTFLSLPSAVSPESSALSGANVSDAQFDTFSMSVHGVSGAAMTPYLALMVSGCLLLTAILAFFFVLSLRIYRGRPFGLLMTLGLAAIAVLNIAGAFIFPALFAQAHTVILADLGIPLEGAPFTNGYFFSEFDLASLVTGIVCALFAGAFHIGTRLQRETEGLI